MKESFILPIALLLLASSTLTHAIDEPARPGDVPKDATWGNGSWFKLIEGRITWEDARRKCEKAGGQLAVIPDAEVGAVVRKLIGNRQCWLGATDKKKEGTWTWVDDTKWDYAKWLGGEPNNGGEKEHYLATAANDRGWVDETDDYGGISGYICQWKPKQESDELSRLKLRWQEARERAVQPIDGKYRQELQKLRDQYTKAGKLKEANEVDKALAEVPL